MDNDTTLKRRKRRRWKARKTEYAKTSLICLKMRDKETINYSLSLCLVGIAQGTINLTDHWVSVQGNPYAQFSRYGRVLQCLQKIRDAGESFVPVNPCRSLYPPLYEQVEATSRMRVMMLRPGSNQPSWGYDRLKAKDADPHSMLYQPNQCQSDYCLVVGCEWQVFGIICTWKDYRREAPLSCL